ncbi:hypothetical protein MKK69_17005 [Methylobacterium sp. J-026]|uniref:hypothetical protein n=1 Tax=Methylobacterium sp. J-026 TaxID=2836624 RepID=UPI001FBBE90D|nr:hypothetical protein [Methylobacterium sp. J-026]MCJ2135732.1 hypothetical protein [Methylobacterium sp. J-026]
MTAMVAQMLGQAADLIERFPGSSAAKRRTVSTAYYAAFHAIMQLCADEILPGSDSNSAEFERVYRQIDHGPLKQAFVSDGPLKINQALRQIGDDIVPLQNARKLADYAPPRPNVFTSAKAREHVDRAGDLVTRLQTLTPQDRRTLALHLLFPPRRK